MMCIGALVHGIFSMAHADQAERPNIIFIMSDDHSQRAIGLWQQANQ